MRISFGAETNERSPVKSYGVVVHQIATPMVSTYDEIATFGSQGGLSLPGMHSVV
jgi:hypothetical protein